MLEQIAIDGPAGAGKSTIAKGVSKKLGFVYVDTGAMYRAMGYFVLKNGIDTNSDEEVSNSALKADISIRYEDGEQIVILNGENVNSYLRTEEVGNMASKISKNPKVRERLVQLQRKLATEVSVVMDGRDIGTVVLPDAKTKIYLTAGADVRAKRRVEQLKLKGEEADFELIKKDIILRDEQDMNREISPLKKAEDAIFLDSSDMTIEEVIDKIIKLSGR